MPNISKPLLSGIQSEDWSVIESFLPQNWQDLADEHKAMRKKKSTGFGNYRNLLRTLLLHSSKGYSLSETSARVKESGIANVSSVAIMNALRSSEGWLESLCKNLYSNVDLPVLASGVNMKICDSTIITEQGKTGSQWRIHYGISLPSFNCSHFLLTSHKGKGSGESLLKYPVEVGDCFIADRGYSRFDDVAYVQKNGGKIILRVHYRMLRFCDVGNEGEVSKNNESNQSNNGNNIKNDNGEKDEFNLLSRLESSLKRSGQVKEWEVYLKSAATGELIKGRLCAIRKSDLQIEKSLKRLKEKASRKSRSKAMESKSLEYAKYIVVFTTLDKDICNAEEILNWYRARWQIELTFKRFKSLAGLGHLPKYNQQSSRAWLYCKLLISLLTEKMINYSTISPWGYHISKS